MSGFTALNGSSPKATTKTAIAASNPSAVNGTTDEQPKAVPAAPAPAPTPTPPAAELAPPPAPVQTPADVPVAVDVPTTVDAVSVQQSIETSASAPASVEVAADVPADAPAPAESSEPLSPTQRESWPTQGLKRNQATAGQSDADTSNKRKRSRSNEGRSQLPNHAPKRAQQSPPQRTRVRTPDSAVTVTQQNGDHPHTESQTKEKEVWYAQSEPDLNQHAETPQTPQYHAPPTGAAPQAPADQQVVQRQPQQQQQQIEYVPITPQADSRAVVQYQQASYSEPRPSNAVVQLDPKKRKRNFSNRTKTGCLTCRRRKKKCDEAKPECNNCIKGAFVCAGYPPQRGAAGWPKMVENKPGGIPLESKDPNYVPPGAYGMPAASPYTSSQAANPGQPSHPPPGGPLKREPLPQYRGQAPLRIEPPNSVGHDGVPPSAAPSGVMPSPEHKLPPGPYTPGNAYPTPVSANTQPPAFGERGGSEYQRSHHDHHMHRPTLSPTPHPPAVSSAQMAAQMALSHPQSQPHSMSVVPYDQRRPTQKEEMLVGGYFFQYDPELSMERDRAATACWRFNTLTYPPTNGVSTEERARLFLEIVQPRDASPFPADEASSRSNVGRVGRHVAVESPFHCDYGYNISIGNNVVIGKGCTMNDAGKIQVGDNTIIGPNVSMYTIELSTDPKHRQGGQGAQLGKGIIIDSDCWIGGGVIIMPGKVIGKGSTVGAGSVVTKDVPPFTVVAGNPARVLRGVASL